MKVVLLSFLFLFSLIADVDAQENFDHRSEIVNFYMADLAVDAKILKYDTANVWIEVLDVLKSNTHNVSKGSKLHVKKPNWPECGFDDFEQVRKRGRFYLEKTGRHWSILDDREDCLIYISSNETYMSMIRQETVVLPVSTFNECLKELVNYYDVYDSGMELITLLPDELIQQKAKTNAIMNGFEKSSRQLRDPKPIPLDIESVADQPINLPCLLAHVPPRFQGISDLDSLSSFIESNISFTSLDTSVTGKIYVQIELSAEGDLLKTELKKGIYPTCDAAVLSFIESMKKWTPAVLLEKQVACFHVIRVIIKDAEN